MKALSFDDIVLVPRFNNIRSREQVDTSVQFGDLLLKIPVFSANMDTITGAAMARKMYDLGGLGFLHRFCSIEHNVQLYRDICADWVDRARPAHQLEFRQISDNDHPGEAVISLGVNESLDRFRALYEVGARYFCIDVAHGHSYAVGDMIRSIKAYDTRTFVIAGNVCTAAGAEYLAAMGADAVKVGIGPGSACSTRVKTGFGIPQFTAIRNCRKVNVFLIADGGIRYPGDAVKALAAGADAIMCGGMFAGCDETPGDHFRETDENSFRHEDNEFGQRKGVMDVHEYKIFRGMASKEAQDDFGVNADWKTAEGVEIKVRAKGPVADVVSDIMGGIRSGMTYCGANNLKQIRERASWVEISAAGAAEGKPHGEGRL